MSGQSETNHSAKDIIEQFDKLDACFRELTSSLARDLKVLRYSKINYDESEISELATELEYDTLCLILEKIFAHQTLHDNLRQNLQEVRVFYEAAGYVPPTSASSIPFISKSINDYFTSYEEWKADIDGLRQELPVVNKVQLQFHKLGTLLCDFADACLKFFTRVEAKQTHDKSVSTQHAFKSFRQTLEEHKKEIDRREFVPQLRPKGESCD